MFLCASSRAKYDHLSNYNRCITVLQYTIKNLMF